MPKIQPGPLSLRFRLVPQCMSLNGSKGLSCSELVGHNGSLSREAMGVLIERRAVVEQNQGDSFEWYFLSSGYLISGNAVIGKNLFIVGTLSFFPSRCNGE